MVERNRSAKMPARKYWHAECLGVQLFSVHEMPVTQRVPFIFCSDQARLSECDLGVQEFLMAEPIFSSTERFRSNLERFLPCQDHPKPWVLHNDNLVIPSRLQGRWHEGQHKSQRAETATGEICSTSGHAQPLFCYFCGQLQRQRSPLTLVQN